MGGIRVGLADLAARGEGPLWQPWADAATGTPGVLITVGKAAPVSVLKGCISKTVISISASPKIC